MQTLFQNKNNRTKGLGLQLSEGPVFKTQYWRERRKSVGGKGEERERERETKQRDREGHRKRRRKRRRRRKIKDKKVGK